MFLSTQLRKESLLSARMSERSSKLQKETKMRNFSHRKVDALKNQHPKIEFRKVIIERGKNSRVREDQDTVVRGLNESSVSVRSNVKEKCFFANESNAFSICELQQNPQKQISKKNQKASEQSERKKFFFVQKLGNAKVLKQKSDQQPIMNISNNQRPLLQQIKKSKSRIDSALSNKSGRNTFKFIKDDLNTELEDRIKKQDIQSSRILRDDKKLIRPLSSTSNKSSFSKMGNNEQRDEIELMTNEKASKGNQDSQRSFYANTQRKDKDQKARKWQEIVEQFESSQKKINSLIEQKWHLIEEKLTDEKQPLTNKDSKGQNTNKKQIQTMSLSRINTQYEPLTMRDQQREKYSFSRVVKQKNLDLQVMNEIKKLRAIDLSKVVFSEEQTTNQEECETIKQRLQQKRSQIIERALAQSMVEAELLKKYYSGQNYNGLSTSNYKVGQQNIKQKLVLKLKTTKSTLIKDVKRLNEQRVSEQRDSITKQSENQIKFNRHKDEDYEKFRYKHPNFKPNLQPMPQTSYRSQFFSYGGIKAYDEPYKQEQNIIFPTTNGLRNSSYRSQYKQMSPEKINFKQLDAYRDKFKQLNVMYIPKKRSESQTNTLKKKKSQYNKFLNQLEYVKRLKTESLIEDSRRKEMAQKVAKQMFMSESRKEYESPDKALQYYMKSEIKHQNLFSLKYDFKKKVHA